LRATYKAWLVLLALTACTASPQGVDGGPGLLHRLGVVASPPTPWARHADALRQVGLHERELGRAWLSAAERAQATPTPITLPFEETLYFDPAEPRAVGYLLTMERGKRLVVALRNADSEPLPLFIDVFESIAPSAESTPTSPTPTPSFSPAPQASSLRHLAGSELADTPFELANERTGKYLVRLQPELLRGGRAVLTMQSVPLFEFPVAHPQGRVGGRFGDPRARGQRKHHGIDIPAPRGTPAIAASDGVVLSAGNNNLGGKVVWLRDSEHGLVLYYAHLDQHSVRSGQQVKRGDTVGLVGNTGNASKTAPHLHFGIYQRGPIDPYPFVQKETSRLPLPSFDDSKIGTWQRTARPVARLRSAPYATATPVMELPRHTPLLVLGGAGAFLRLRTPDEREAFVLARVMEPVDKPLRNTLLTQSSVVRRRPSSTAVAISELAANTRVNVLGQTQDFMLVDSSAGVRGWVLLPGLGNGG
jgi:murein DD-endopeptidase MepM/ murein hydrolase activator NlpD